MNIRSLTRGDGVVIGAAVLLFIASFLDYYSVDCSGAACDSLELPNAWEIDKLFLVLPTIILTGLISAALIATARFQPEGRKINGISLDQWGTGLAVTSVWAALWGLIVVPENASLGIGSILALLATLALTAGAILPERVPALKAPLMGAPRPQAPSPYGAGPNPGYGYPGQQGAPSPYGAPQPGHQGYGNPGGQQPYGGGQQPGQPGPAAGPQGGQPGPAGGGDFAPFWFAVPIARPLYSEDGSPSPIAELAPGTWYLAVEQRGPALIAQTQDGRRGVLQDTTGIQRG
ncbi:hypothetical protein ABZW18_11520 [Streptomyces sp. NPDC004647]|uniref:hypothetical protein n=1 Tax=Streptomyces sp. NPDC004647 TaxID=3154671 RepID=UPI0033B9DE5E